MHDRERSFCRKAFGGPSVGVRRADGRDGDDGDLRRDGADGRPVSGEEGRCSAGGGDLGTVEVGAREADDDTRARQVRADELQEPARDPQGFRVALEVLHRDGAGVAQQLLERDEHGDEVGVRQVVEKPLDGALVRRGPLVVAEGRAKGLAAEFEEAEAREAAAVRAQGEVERHRPLGVRRRRPLAAGAQLAGREAREAVRRRVLGRERVAVEVREGGHEDGLAAGLAADDGEARHRCQGEVVTVQDAPARRTVQKSALAA